MIQIPFLNTGRATANVTVLKSPVETDERRKELRYPTDGWAKVVVPFLPEPQIVSAHVVDVSRGGMRLKLQAPLEPGTLLQIEMKSVLATGEVRYCRPDGNEYSVGIQLDEVGDNGQTV